ncbi:MAG TPA: hypothetical protein VLA13_07720 [Massilibacterium sp.]|nr:hypothetical protein [Massilibacterium sp.]
MFFYTLRFIPNERAIRPSLQNVKVGLQTVKRGIQLPVKVG